MRERKNASYVRFTLGQRLEHILLIVTFSMLCLTGLPQMFYGERWAQAILALLGGIEGAREIHHLFGLMLIFQALYHAIVAAYELLFTRPRRLAMLPQLQDVRDGLGSLFYLLGLRPQKPRYGRFDFKQKLEYWAMIWGTVVMGLTGLLLLFPVLMTRHLPGILLPVAKVIHGYEAILAFLAIITWHFYNAHLGQGVFPFDASIFTGKISRERMEEEHPLEYEERVAGKGAGASERTAGSG